MKEPRLISLFCGPGGFDLGFKQAQFQTLLAADIDEAALVTHRHNHPEAGALKWDLSQVGPETIIAEWERRSPEPPTGVIGGPPCQSFSAGNRSVTDDDPRHQLPIHYAKILKGLNARYSLDFFVFENVLGLLHKNNQERWKHFTYLFQEAGFNIFVEKLDAADFGVPQVRKRVFIVGLNRERFGHIWFRFPPPQPEPRRTVRDALAGLPEPVPFAPGLSREEIPHHPNHWHMVPRSKKFSTGELHEGRMAKSFKVLRWDTPSWTVAYGNREVHIHPSGKRRLSVYEAMRLQGFPHEYEILGTLSQQIRLVSEVVAPPVARALALAIREQLGYGTPEASEA